MRPYLAVLAALAIAACSNGKFNPIVEGAVNEILPGDRAPDGGAPGPRGPLW